MTSSLEGSRMPGGTKARLVNLPLGAPGHPLPFLGFLLLARVEGRWWTHKAWSADLAMVAPPAHLFSNHSSQVLLSMSKLFGRNENCTSFF